MKRSTSRSVNLSVSAPNLASEIFLIDAGLKRIASGVGELNTTVAPGVYKLRFRSGAAQYDSLLSIEESESYVSVPAPDFPFPSAAPLGGSRRSSYDHASAALEHSKTVHVHAGSGSQLLLLVREEMGGRDWPDCDMSVFDLNGNLVADLSAGVVDSNARFAAVNLGLNPGAYAIRVGSGHLGTYEMFVYLSPGWQNQLFFSFDDFWLNERSFRAPSMRSASWFMARIGVGFSPDNQESVTVELLRQSLGQGRDVLSDHLLDRLTGGDYHDPMLAIHSCHLLSQRRHRDRAALVPILEHLRTLLGDHPDVQALEISAGMFDPRGVVEIPPALRKSWDEIVRATRRRAGIVPPDSILSRIAGTVAHGDPWLVRRVPKMETYGVAPSTSLAEAKRIADRLVSSGGDQLVKLAAQSRAEKLSDLEHAVLNSVAAASGKQKVMDSMDIDQSIRVGASTLLNSVDAPSYAVANAVASLANKLEIDS